MNYEYPLVWAKVEPWPFWPAIVQKISKSSSLRVTFVDKTWTEDDVSVSHIVPFDQSAQGLSFQNSDLEWAVKKGIFLLNSTEDERRRFVNSFKYPFSKTKTITSSSLCPRVSLSSRPLSHYSSIESRSCISEYEKICLENIEERKRYLEPLSSARTKTLNLPKTIEYDFQKRNTLRSRKIEAIEHHLEWGKYVGTRQPLVEGMRTYKRSSKDILDDVERKSEIGEEEYLAPSERSFSSMAFVPSSKQISPNEGFRGILSSIPVCSANKMYDQMSVSTDLQCRQKTLETISSRSKDEIFAFFILFLIFGFL
ncbi:unnamed protein product [Lepeophtheirus salmonis]|uniref:(salmon louse) hypothetical protein n=1 Tax=Lepeophtheirus salmonis TaxID=72036 RepID=A0A7R8H0V1_LEPSM|nr:unnamed protein product [Lepeophtheirus salmonis]CAF2777277.1 unnamed protein product [Lepeophtheirus salmonis]